MRYQKILSKFLQLKTSNNVNSENSLLSHLMVKGLFNVNNCESKRSVLPAFFIDRFLAGWHEWTVSRRLLKIGSSTERFGPSALGKMLWSEGCATYIVRI